MDKTIRLIVVGVFIVFIQSCASKNDYSSGDKIGIHWEILTNFTEQKDVFNGRFTITNNSQFSLSDKNWALFFNMAPRPILVNATPQPAVVKHINGDWYKLVPESGFTLAPGVPGKQEFVDKLFCIGHHRAGFVSAWSFLLRC